MLKTNKRFRMPHRETSRPRIRSVLMLLLLVDIVGAVGFGAGWVLRGWMAPPPIDVHESVERMADKIAKQRGYND